MSAHALNPPFICGYQSKSLWLLSHRRCRCSCCCDLRVVVGGAAKEFIDDGQRHGEHLGLLIEGGLATIVLHRL